MWLRLLVRMPPEGGPEEGPGHAGGTMFFGIPPEELPQVATEREV